MEAESTITGHLSQKTSCSVVIEVVSLSMDLIDHTIVDDLPHQTPC